MTDLPPTAPTPEPPDEAPAGGSAPESGSRVLAHLNLIVVPALCLAALGFMYQRLSGDIAELRESQRQLVAELASMRRTPLVDLSNAPMQGREDALVTLIEYSDYECPFCIRYSTETRPRIFEEYVDTGRIRYAFRDYPVDELHPQAIKAHEASRCALEQGRFWEMHPRLFSASGTHSDEALRALAAEVGLDMAAFDECYASGRSLGDIRRTADEALNMGGNGTPAFFLGLYDPAVGQVRILRGITGAQPFEVFAQNIELLLQQAGQ